MRWLVDKLWLNLRSKYYFRRSFYLQAAMMFLNNLLWIAVISLLFARTGSIGGFNRAQYLVVFSYTVLVYGLVFLFFGGLRKIWQYIVEGNLDRFMVVPRNLLINVAISDTRVASIGDISQGLLFLALLGAPLRLLMFLPASFVVAFSFMVIVNSLYFFMRDFTGRVQRQLLHFLISTGMWPVVILQGPLRFFFYYVIPGGTIFFYAVQQAYSGGWAPKLWLLSMVFPVVALAVWRIGLRRYSSSNLGFNVNEA